MRHAGLHHQAAELVRAGEGLQAFGHLGGDAEAALVAAAAFEQFLLDAVAVAAVGGHLDQRAHQRQRVDRPGGGAVGQEFALAAVAHQRHFEHRAIGGQQIKTDQGQAGAVHARHVQVELGQLGTERRAAAGVAALEVGQFVGQHGVRLALVEHAQQRQADVKAAAPEGASLHLHGAFGDEKIGVDAGDDAVRRGRAHLRGQRLDAGPQRRRIGLAHQFPVDRHLAQQARENLRHRRQRRRPGQEAGHADQLDRIDVKKPGSQPVRQPGEQRALRHHDQRARPGQQAPGEHQAAILRLAAAEGHARQHDQGQAYRQFEQQQTFHRFAGHLELPDVAISLSINVAEPAAQRGAVGRRHGRPGGAGFRWRHGLEHGDHLRPVGRGNRQVRLGGAARAGGEIAVPARLRMADEQQAQDRDEKQCKQGVAAEAKQVAFDGLERMHVVSMMNNQV